MAGAQIVPETTKWLLSDPQQVQLQTWIERLTIEAAANLKPPHPIIEEFKNLIETDADLDMHFIKMLSEVPIESPFDKDPFGGPQVRDYNLMLKLFNVILTGAPEFSTSIYVGFPINAILRWPMGTRSDCAAFLNSKVNAQIRMMLDEWARFLSSEESASVLNADPERGWFGKKAMEMNPDFEARYACDPTVLHHGFKSCS